MIAALSDGVPPTAVYLVKPLLIAPMAASLMCCGVSKSGSPAPSPMMSLPSAFSFAARAVTARVGEGLMACTRVESSKIFPCGLNVSANYTLAVERVNPGADGVLAGSTFVPLRRHEQPGNQHKDPEYGVGNRKDPRGKIVEQNLMQPVLDKRVRIGTAA